MHVVRVEACHPEHTLARSKQQPSETTAPNVVEPQADPSTIHIAGEQASEALLPADERLTSDEISEAALVLALRGSNFDVAESSQSHARSAPSSPRPLPASETADSDRLAAAPTALDRRRSKHEISIASDGAPSSARSVVTPMVARKTPSASVDLTHDRRSTAAVLGSLASPRRLERGRVIGVAAPEHFDFINGTDSKTDDGDAAGVRSRARSLAKSSSDRILGHKVPGMAFLQHSTEQIQEMLPRLPLMSQPQVLKVCLCCRWNALHVVSGLTCVCARVCVCMYVCMRGCFA